MGGFVDCWANWGPVSWDPVPRELGDPEQEAQREETLALAARLPFEMPSWYLDHTAYRDLHPRLARQRDEILTRIEGLKKMFERTRESLRRTAEIEAWFAKAHEMDIARHTQLGTLGYLPIEIRLQIWKWLVTLEPWNMSNDCLISIENVGPRFFKKFYVHTYEIPTKQGWNASPFAESMSGRSNHAAGMDKVSHDMATEIMDTFHLHHTLAFPDPETFQTFIQTVPRDTKLSFAFYIRIYEKAEWRKRQGGCTRAWIEVMEWIPKNTRSVTFELGRWTLSLKGQLHCLDVLNKRIKRFAPGAVGRIAECSEGANLDGRWKMWEEALRDVD